MNETVEALYIHIPFCHQLCHYCDFAKLYVNEKMVEHYIKALLIEIELKIQSHVLFSSIYIGGGTPSILSPSDVGSIFSKLKGHIQEGAEITFEMNPEDVTKEYVQMLYDCGVNRISLGVQSFSDELIQRVGRNHTSQKSIEAIEILKASSIQNITIDLMFALPGQTLEDVICDVRLLEQLDLPHISLYSLILEERTRLYLQQDKYEFVDEDTEAEMYSYIIDTLRRIGYTQYEMSNFAKVEKFESHHNLAYWHQKQYYGLGLGAHEFIGNIRSANTKSINSYTQSLFKRELPICESEVLTCKQQFEEFCFLAFRDCVRGLDLIQLQQQYPTVYADTEEKLKRIIKELEVTSLIHQYAENCYKLTKKGQMLANEVFKAFVNIE